MSVEGTWTITIKGPTGAESTTLVFDSKDGKLGGTQSGKGIDTPVLDAKFEDGKLYWVSHVAKPMKMKLEYNGVVDGDTVTGKVKAGFMGSFPFTGVRS